MNNFLNKGIKSQSFYVKPDSSCVETQKKDDTEASASNNSFKVNIYFFEFELKYRILFFTNFYRI